MAYKAAELAGLDVDDLTPKQLRKLLRCAAMSTKDMTKEDREEDAERAIKENDDLVDLGEESHGKMNAPKVTKDDLPPGFADDEEDDKKPPKKVKKNGRA